MRQDLYPACETRTGKNPLPPVITAAQPESPHITGEEENSELPNFLIVDVSDLLSQTL